MLDMYNSSADDEKGIESDDELKAEVSRLVNQCYELPCGMSYIRGWAWTSRLPFCPTFSGFQFSCKPKYRLWKGKSTGTDEDDVIPEK